MWQLFKRCRMGRDSTWWNGQRHDAKGTGPSRYAYVWHRPRYRGRREPERPCFCRSSSRGVKPVGAQHLRAAQRAMRGAQEAAPVPVGHGN